MLLQDAVRATVEDDIREEIFEDGEYNEARHPSNQVELTYNVRYTDCPTLDASTGMLTGHIRETQVSYALPDSFLMPWLHVK